MKDLTPEGHMRNLVDLCFQIGLVISDPQYKFHEQSQEERAKWIARQLKLCGYPTIPMGSSWGHLQIDKIKATAESERG